MQKKLTVRERMARLDEGYERDDETDTVKQLRAADMDAYNKAREATKALLDATNTMGAEDHVMLGVIAGIMETHRYLQGQGIPAIIKAIGEFGRLCEETPHLSDMRNAHVVSIAKLLRDGLSERIYWED